MAGGNLVRVRLSRIGLFKTGALATQSPLMRHHEFSTGRLGGVARRLALLVIAFQGERRSMRQEPPCLLQNTVKVRSVQEPRRRQSKARFLPSLQGRRQSGWRVSRVAGVSAPRVGPARARAARAAGAGRTPDDGAETPGRAVGRAGEPRPRGRWDRRRCDRAVTAPGGGGLPASPSAASSPWTAWGSVTAPRIRRGPPQRGQTRTSSANTRRRSGAQGQRRETGAACRAAAGDGVGTMAARQRARGARTPRYASHGAAVAAPGRPSVRATPADPTPARWSRRARPGGTDTVAGRPGSPSVAPVPAGGARGRAPDARAGPAGARAPRHPHAG